MFLALKTDDTVTEIYVVKNTTEVVAEKKWPSGRQLSDQLLAEIEKLIGGQWQNLNGLIVFSGPGSFTGLRIGIAVMNSLAYGLDVPIVGASGDNWLESGVQRLLNSQNHKIVIPNYGAAANISQPKK